MTRPLRPLIPLLALSLAFAGCQSSTTENTLPNQPSSSLASPVSISRSSPFNASSPSHHPVSLPSLMDREYTGRDLTLGQTLADNTVYTRYAVTYKSDDLTISGIMNIPKGEGPFPVIITNHGYIDPAVYTIGRGLKREQDYLARNGFAVLHPDYRNHADSGKDPENDERLRMGYVIDVINAVHAIKNSGIASLDTAKIGMLGHSMGGGVTLNTIVAQPELVQAAVLFAPVSSNAWQNVERWMLRDNARRAVAEQITQLYGTPDTQPEFWKNVSAKHFFDRVITPVQIHHGTADKDVPVEWSRDTERSMKDAGTDVELFIYENQPHEFTSDWATVMRRTVEFYRAHL